MYILHTYIYLLTLHANLCLYGVATISMLFKIINLFCKRFLSKKSYSAKETYNFKETTIRSHPICFFI